MALQPDFGRLGAWSPRFTPYLAVVWLTLGLLPAPATAHGHLVYPKSRAAENITSDIMNWPIAGIPARLRREPCAGLKPNKVFTKVQPGPLTLKFLFPDGANHTGYCNAYLYDPVKPHGKLKIGEMTNCARSLKSGAGKKGEDIPGTMSVTIPQVVPCNPSHCVLLWEWTATHVSATDIERFEHYDNCADLDIVGAKEGDLTETVAIRGSTVNSGSPASGSPNLFEQDWRLNLDRSFLYLQSVKNKSIFETHGFTHMDGKITPDGDAKVTLDLASFETGIDLRNVRMRFLFFKTFQYPEAVITAKLDRSKLEDLETKISLTYPLDFTIELHGTKKEMTRDVVVTRIADSAVSVTVTKPIIILAKDFGLEGGVGKLEEAANVVISPVASITFQLVFEGTKLNPAIEQAYAQKENSLIEQRYQTIDSAKCATRLAVLSESRSIYFRLGSSDLDEESHFALDQIAEFAVLCPDIRIKVGGHTDNIGSASANLSLSKERAQSVVNYLVDEGVPPDKLVAVGYGDSYPQAPNDSPANRAKNRRIEFGLMEDANEAK